MSSQPVTIELPASDLDTRRLLSLTAEQSGLDQITFAEGSKLRVQSGGPPLLNINAICRFVAGSGDLGKDLLGSSPAAQAQVWDCQCDKYSQAISQAASGSSEADLR